MTCHRPSPTLISVEAIEGLARFLKHYGAWGFVALEAVVIWRLGHYIKTIHTRHQETVKQLLLDHNREQKEETHQLVSAMLSTDRALQSIGATLNALITRGR